MISSVLSHLHPYTQTHTHSVLRCLRALRVCENSNVSSPHTHWYLCLLPVRVFAFSLYPPSPFMIALEAHGTCVPVSPFQSRVYLLHPSPSSGCTPQGSNGGFTNSHKKTSNVYIVQDRNVCIEDMRLFFSFLTWQGMQVMTAFLFLWRQ